jgi:plasmid maintenance system killer protein
MPSITTSCTGRSRGSRVVQRKLAQLHAAQGLDDLRAPPGNHLEALAGDWRAQHSIRINDQYRICFVWKDGDAQQVQSWSPRHLAHAQDLVLRLVQRTS